MMEAANVERFTLRELFSDAIGALRSDWQAHLGWNVIWLGFALVTCCGFGTVVAGLGAFAVWQFAPSRDGVGAMSPGAILALVAVYLVLLQVTLALYALHQSVTMVLARARLHGSPVTMSEAIKRGLGRAPALTAHVMVRMFVEALPLVVVYALILTVVVSWVGSDITQWNPAAFGRAGPVLWIAITVVYVALLAFAFGIRGFTGVSFPCVVSGTGPIAALGESARLLRTRRWLFVRFRLVVVASWVLSYATCMGPFFALSLATAGRPNPMVSLVSLPLMLGFYGVILALIVVDAVAEACFHARLTRPLDAAVLAETFA